jgi:hypothetical protein
MSAAAVSIPLLDLRRRRIPSDVERLHARDVLGIALETLGTDRVR